MSRMNALLRLWYYAHEHAPDILSLTCEPNLLFGEQTPYQIVTQIRPDISHHSSFAWYTWVWHWDEIRKVKQLG